MVKLYRCKKCGMTGYTDCPETPHARCGGAFELVESKDLTVTDAVDAIKRIKRVKEYQDEIYRLHNTISDQCALLNRRGGIIDEKNIKIAALESEISGWKAGEQSYKDKIAGLEAKIIAMVNAKYPHPDTLKPAHLDQQRERFRQIARVAAAHMSLCSMTIDQRADIADAIAAGIEEAARS